MWATKRRERLISSEMEPALFGYITKRCTDAGVFVYALNGAEHHVHLVCSIPPRLAVAHVAEKVKGASSHYINYLEGRGWRLYWQQGYGCLALARKDLERVIEYVENQKRHHADGTLWASPERLGEEAPNGQSE